MQKNNKKNSYIAVSISFKQGNSFDLYCGFVYIENLAMFCYLEGGHKTAEKVWLEYSRTFSYYYYNFFLRDKEIGSRVRQVVCWGKNSLIFFFFLKFLRKSNVSIDISKIFFAAL